MAKLCTESEFGIIVHSFRDRRIKQIVLFEHLSIYDLVEKLAFKVSALNKYVYELVGSLTINEQYNVYKLNSPLVLTRTLRRYFYYHTVK